MAEETSPPIRSRDIGVLRAGWSYASIGDKISDIVLTRPVRWPWMLAFLATLGGTVVFLGAIAYLFAKGIGIWGVRIPVAWGFAIANFVWWIGIGHAGTFISAILLLLRQKWRTSINRFAEAMTLFAVAMAGLFPILHLGRPWFFYWIVPYPDRMNVWPQWRSPLVWDLFAISTYIIVSLLFWYMGLVPDLATLRDRASARWKQLTYGLMALGWRGEARDWARHQSAYLLMAGLATPLVVSVHSVVSLDFAIGNTPGYHSTIFPPYFVAGALFSGFAMVLTLAIPLRKMYHLEDFITMRHIENMAKVMLATGLVCIYGYACEAFFGWYSGNEYERFLVANRTYFGPYAWSYWVLILCNFLVPQMMWSKRLRRNLVTVFIAVMFVNVGMWLERFVIIVTSLHRDFLPGSWGMYYPSKFDWSFYIGSIGMFLTLIYLFIRVLPAIAMFEVRMILPKSEKGGSH